MKAPAIAAMTFEKANPPPQRQTAELAQRQDARTWLQAAFPAPTPPVVTARILSDEASERGTSVPSLLRGRIAV
jgi:hypothetical protein